MSTLTLKSICKVVMSRTIMIQHFSSIFQISNYKFILLWLFIPTALKDNLINNKFYLSYYIIVSNNSVLKNMDHKYLYHNISCDRGSTTKLFTSVNLKVKNNGRPMKRSILTLHETLLFAFSKSLF